MPKRTKPDDEDIAAFYQAMKGTKPLSQPPKIRLRRAQKTDRPTQKKAHPSESLLFYEVSSLPPVVGEEFISYKQEGVSNKTLRKLRKGQYNVEATLDLHGMTVEQAMNALEVFLHRASLEGKRMVLIIHGKGHHSQEEPILKNKINHWLRNMNFVLAFCSASPAHGSRGASYVLLKRATQENSA